MCNPNDSMCFTTEPEWAASTDNRLRALEWAFGAVDVGLVLVDVAGHPVFANATARRLAAQRDGLKLSSLGLATGDAASSRRLIEMVCQLAFLRATGPQRLRVERSSTDRAFLLTLVRVPTADLLDAIAMKAVVAVFIRELGAEPRVNRETLAASFGLTRREAEIAALLGQGVGLQSIAKTLKIGLGTVRSHLKHVFHKTGTSSQMKLAMLVREFADPLDLSQTWDGRSA